MTPVALQTTENSLFTRTEAAVLTRFDLKAVNNAIDKKTVRAATGHRAGYAMRVLDPRALMSMSLERRLADRFVPELRREVFAALAECSSFDPGGSSSWGCAFVRLWVRRRGT